MKILDRSHSKPMAALHAAAFPPAEAWPEAKFADLLEWETCRAFAHVEAEAIDAMLVVQLSADMADILTLATHPRRQRQGLARGLIQQAEVQLHTSDTRRWTLDVAVDNHSAQSFYKSLGFTVDGRRKNYYRRPFNTRLDALLMSCPFTRHSPSNRA